MAIIKATNSNSSIKTALGYITQENKTEIKYTTGINCNPSTAVEEMQFTKAEYKKETGRQYAHIIQSFNPKDKITPEEGHQIGLEFIERNKKFKGYEIVIATHLDKGHLHNHIIINSVSYTDGKKFHTTKKDLEEFKVLSNNLSLEHNLTVPSKGTETTSFNQKKYKVIEKGARKQGQSYVLDTALIVSQILRSARSREEFIREMEKQKYKVSWTDKRKYITFTTPDNKKIRNSNLEKTFKEYKFSKEGIENELQSNREQYGTEQFRNVDPRNKRTESINAELHKSSNERGSNEELNNRERIGEHKENKQGNTEQNGFDIREAREHTKRLRQESTASIINWKERTRTEQSQSNNANAEEQSINRRELQNNREHNKREFKELTNGINENYGQNREQDFGFDR